MPNIGQWVCRITAYGSKRRQITFWHLVESFIEDAAITKCGRRMEPVKSHNPLEFQETVSNYYLCRNCQ